MKLLLVHNYYQQLGGEAQVFESERKLLEDHGNEVVLYTDHNDRITELDAAELSLKTLWNRRAHDEVLELIERERPDLMHVHNTFPLISPAVYHAAARVGLPVVQTLHNYRLLCPMSEFYRDGSVCEDCLGRVPWPGVLHACYRDSRLHTAGVASMLMLHRFLNTWTEKIAAYITLTEFGRRKFAEGGIPVDRIFVKPNFVDPDPGPGLGEGGYALFAGRLSETKGVRVLLRAWEGIGELPPLKIVGDGPLSDYVEEIALKSPSIEWIGRRDREEVLSLMKNAVVLLVPSVWYEGQPVVISEAFACGLPVVASRLGAMEYMVDDGRTGYLFRPGDSDHLTKVITDLLSNSTRLTPMRRVAREEYETKYTADINYEILLNIYQSASRVNGRT